jgi:putative transposase
MAENLKYIQETPDTPAQTSPSTIVAVTLTRDDMERRRMEAADDFLHGLSHSHVVAKYGVSRTTASRWHRALTARGLEALRKGKATGRPCRLTAEQQSQITDVFGQGTAALGYAADRWTPTLLARMIEERFSVRYSLDHVTRLMAKLVLARNQASHTAVKAAARGTQPHAT